MNGKSLLLIGDKTPVSESISRLFQEAGYATACVPDETEGLRRALEAEFDVVVMNIHRLEPDELEQILRSQSVARQAQGKKASAPQAEADTVTSLREMEKIHIERVLRSFHWNQTAAADALGIDRKTLRNRIREFHLSKDD